MDLLGEVFSRGRMLRACVPALVLFIGALVLGWLAGVPAADNLGIAAYFVVGFWPVYVVLEWFHDRRKGRGSER